jgi:Rad3-related DNA helicase
MSEEKLKEAVRRINELRYRLEPVEQHWAWTAEQLHHELRHVLHSLNGLVSYLSSAREVGADAPPPASEDESGAAKVTDNPI